MRCIVKTVAALFIIIMYVGLGSTLAQSGPVAAADVPEATRQQMLRLLPDPLPKGAVGQRGPDFYGANVYEYMDGAADPFLLYDFKALLHQEYRVGQADITTDIFDMALPENAFGIYAAERSPNYNFLSIGAEGYSAESTLNFIHGRYYVKLSGFGEGAAAALNEFARAISARIGGTPSFPAALQSLPKENRVAHSEQYMRKDPLGHPFLGPAYVVAYSSGNRSFKLMLTVANDAADARDRLTQLDQHFRKTGTSVPAPSFADGAIKGTNSFEGTLVAGVNGRYLLLILDPSTGDEEHFKKALSGLRNE